MAVSSATTRIGVPAFGGLSLPLAEAGVDRLDDVLERQPGGEVLLGGVAALGVDHAVGGEVEDALAGDPAQALGRLHDREGVVEGLEVAHERPGVGALAEPLAQAVGVAGRQPGIPDLVGDLDDGLRAQAAVEVVVQQRLGRAADPLVDAVRDVRRVAGALVVSLAAEDHAPSSSSG